ncbi:FAD:protein FMN transferase [Microlunatus panaciterrae]|uniref:FAD:protein FMN transferase n=1 Tax=Microlunatus panaciterrae TaxID=400768 RepID=A0ABS2RFC0_9ACTN|nr:FAD:protein FMN transferase [Microlunatus panaciterrae]MBM7797700.1 thiamine biosynthesis lipoprotein [Microlunatus panaciterrae]
MRHSELVMGIPMSVDIRADDEETGFLTEAVQAAFSLLHEDDRRFSPFLTDSEVSRVNRGELTPAVASPLLRQVLSLGARLEDQTDGAFSCRRPDGSLDTNGVVKGWSVQRAVDVLMSRGLTTFCFNAGGDVVVRGEPEPGRPWHVAVRSPEDAHRPLAVFALRDQAVATSGGYERGEHIWDGRTGRAARSLCSVTVVASDLTTADLLATAVYALGADGVSWAAEAYQCSVLAVTSAGDLQASGDVERLLAGSGGGTEPS